MSDGAKGVDSFASIVAGIKDEIRNTQAKTIRQVNSNLIMMYFRIGKILFENSLNDGHFIKRVATELKIEYPKLSGFSEGNLRRMRKFYDEYRDDEKKWSQLVTEISWGHNILLLSKIKDKSVREIYMKAAIENGWSRNVLDWQIETNYHKRIGNSSNNLKMRCYVVVELKATKYIPEFAGKMNFYLSAVDDLIKAETDNPTIGLILCKEKDKFTANYSLKDINKPIGVSSFKTEKKLLEDVLNELPTEEELNMHLSLRKGEK